MIFLLVTVRSVVLRSGGDLGERRQKSGSHQPPDGRWGRRVPGRFGKPHRRACGGRCPGRGGDGANRDGTVTGTGSPARGGADFSSEPTGLGYDAATN